MWSKLIPLLLATTTTKTLRSPRDLIQQYEETYRRLEVVDAWTAAADDVESANGGSSTSAGNCRVYPTARSTLRFIHHDQHENKLNRNQKPIAVYLPGLDGYGISAVAQLDDLEKHFDFWRLTVDRSDRSSFVQVVTTIADFVSTQFLLANQGDHSSPQQRHVTLIGESTGGLLAAAVALQLQKKQQKKSVASNNNNNNQHGMISGLVLVNPATSFEATSWASAVPLLTSLFVSDDENSNSNNNGGPSAYGILGSFLLASLVPDAQQSRRIWDTLRTLPDLDSAVTTTPQMLWDSFRTTEQTLPAAMLEHRVTQWLTVGAPIVNARLQQLQNLPMLVVAGAEDRLLPSKQEAQRLQETCGAETLVVPNRGHYVLDDTVNLTEAIMYSPTIDPLQRWRQQHKQPTNQKPHSYDPITDWKVSESELVEYIERGPVQTLRSVFSPVYFSTDASTGKRWKGLGKLPSSSSSNDRRRPPLLFVGNHQFAALDLQLLVADLWKERRIVVRGLAHPVTFMGGASAANLNFRDLDGRRPGLVGNNNNNNFGPANFEKFGAVKVTPRNYYRLMQTGQDALLFPGGAKEALSGNSSYPLFWPDKTDFVRTAARFNATIVPVSAVGMLDSVRVLAEPQDFLQLPVIGEQLRKQQSNITAARYDAQPLDEIVGFPLALPGLPQRNYFLFGSPVDTSCLDPNDKEACARVYQQVRDQVRRGVDDLLVARERDPFRNTPRRLLYERVWGKQAPTVSVDEMNAKKM